MMRKLRDHFEEIAGGILLVVMCLIGVIQIVSRYILTSPLAWTEELATILFAWLVFVGASLALKKNEHFAIDVFVKLLPESMQKYTTAVRHFAVLLFCLLLIVYGIKLVVMNWHVLTPMLEVSRGWAYLSLPFGSLLMLGRALEMILRSLRAGESLPEHSIGEGFE